MKQKVKNNGENNGENKNQTSSNENKNIIDNLDVNNEDSIKNLFKSLKIETDEDGDITSAKIYTDEKGQLAGKTEGKAIELNDKQITNLKNKLNKSAKWKNFKDNNKDDEDFKDAISALTVVDNKQNKLHEYSEDEFIKLGKTVSYRSLLTAYMTINSGEDFKKITNDVFKNDPDNVIGQLADLDEYFNFAAACNTVNKKLEKENPNSSVYKKAAEYSSQLQDPESRYTAINAIEKEWNQDYKTNRNIVENAFDKGMKEQKEEMAKPDYEWKDPTTGVPPKGAENLSKWVGKGISKLADIGNKLASKIPSEHNLENDMARLAVMGVKLVANGVHAIGSLLGIIKKTNLYKKITKKSVDKKYKDFEQKYNEAKKNNYLPSQINDDSDEELKKKKDQFEQDFKSLLYDELIMFYYKQIRVFIDCAYNQNKFYILNETNDGWNTKPSVENANLSALNDAKIQLKEHIDKMIKFFDNEKLWTEFKDFKMETVLGAVRDDKFLKKFDSNLQNDIKIWLQNIEKNDKNSKTVDELFNIPMLYDKNLFLIPSTINALTLSKYKDKLNGALQVINKIKSIPLLKNYKLAFKGNDISTKVGGIITLAARKQNQEDVQKLLSDFNNDIKYSDLDKNFDDIDKKLSTVLDDYKEEMEHTGKIDKYNEIDKKYTEDDLFSKLLKVKEINKELNNNNSNKG